MSPIWHFNNVILNSTMNVTMNLTNSDWRVNCSQFFFHFNEKRLSVDYISWIYYQICLDKKFILIHPRHCCDGSLAKHIWIESGSGSDPSLAVRYALFKLLHVQILTWNLLKTCNNFPILSMHCVHFRYLSRQSESHL